MTMSAHGDLQRRFGALLSPWSGSAVTSPWFHAVRERHAEPQRLYHNLDHVAACLRQLDQVREQLQDPVAVELALWFHDVIYDPKAKDNEARSAEFARDALQASGVDATRIASVESLILLTRHAARPDSADGCYLVDIDLAILGANADLYAQYERWIRQEYRHVPNILFRFGRKRLLREFLRRRAIFLTDHFHQRLEQQARINLQWAIDQL